MTRHRLSDIAAALGARLEGRADLFVTGAAEPAMAGPDDLALAMEPGYAEGLAQGQARAALVWEGADWRAMGLQAALFAPRPRYAMAHLTRALDPGPDLAPGIHPMAVIDPTAILGPGASVGPFAVVGARSRIGANARICAHASIGADVVIGDDLLLHAGARIGDRVRIGARFIGHANSVVGGDGFSFVSPQQSRLDEVHTRADTAGTRPLAHWERIHSLGGVEIGDDVELGTLSAIDRGTIRATRIGNGTKIDNQVQVGHNCIIGDNCLLCGQTGVAGSARIGNRVVLGARVGVSDNIFVGDDVIAGAATNIYTNAPAGRVLMGSPAVKAEQHIEITKSVRRLPRMAAKLAELQETVRILADKVSKQ